MDIFQELVIDAVEARLAHLEARLSKLEARLALDDAMPANIDPHIAPIIRVVSDHFHLTPTDLICRTRRERIAWPRQVAMFFIRTRLQWSLAEIGRAFGKDHGTVLHGVRSVEDRINLYPAEKQHLAAIEARLDAIAQPSVSSVPSVP